jgi:3-hydroxymyristoyl/3-hydroxydecanoyl-(acyl carrier protein) dehydratase
MSEQPQSVVEGVLLCELQVSELRLTATIEVRADCPLFEGHFPDRPVLPAVGLLGAVIALGRLLVGGHVVVEEIPRMKLVRAIGPGARLRCELVRDEQRVRWRVLQGEETAASGQLLFCVR